MIVGRSQASRRVAVAALLCVTAAASAPARAATLWSDDRVSPGGAGWFFGPGSWAHVEPLFPVTIRNIGFQSDTDFVTPFRNTGGKGLATAAETAFGLKDGKTSDGALINENVDTGAFSIAGTRLMPVVVRADGKFGGSQVAVSVRGGDVVMVMDLALDLGIGPRGLIKLPFYGTTGTVTVPKSLQTQAGGTGIDKAGAIASGTVIAGRVGDFNHDGYISGTLVAAGVMPMDSLLYAGQPWVMVRNFQTDIAADGQVFGASEPSAKPPLQAANGP